MRTISIRLDEQTDAALLAFCRRHGVSQTDAVKCAIGQLDEQPRPTPAQLAEQHGLIGAFRSGDGELAAQHSQRIKQRLRAATEGTAERTTQRTTQRRPTAARKKG